MSGTRALVARRALWAACLPLLTLWAASARAEVPLPPPGWEAPPPLTVAAPPPPPTKKGKPTLPACCGYDEICCTRQLTLDGATPDRVARVVEVRAADLPELVVKEAPEGGPPLAGTPGLRVTDGLGRPAPWLDGPKVEVRLVPLGRYGEMIFGEREWARPFFRARELSGMGSGVSLGVGEGVKDARAILTGKIEFTTIDQGDGGAVVVDYVTGRLVGTPEVAVSRWAHVEAAPVTSGFVSAFRGWPPHEVAHGAEGQAVTFLLPEIILGFESKDTKHTGGFLPVRGSSSVAFTTFSLPTGPGRSSMARFRILDHEIGRWFPPPPGTPHPARLTMVALASSQTSVEAAPRVRVVFFAE